MANKKTPLAIVVAVIVAATVLSVAAAGVLTSSKNVPAGGTVSQIQASINIGVYADSGCTQTASYVDWGTLQPGDTVTKTLWIKNTGNTDATLSLTANTWSPTNAATWITVSWDKQNANLTPNQPVQATLTLHVATNIDSGITNFSFNMLISGTG